MSKEHNTQSTIPTNSVKKNPSLALNQQLLRRKPISQMLAGAGADIQGNKLVRSLGLWHLTAISIGATLGGGILVILGESVPIAGPSVWIAFLLAGFAALLSALSYAEMAGAVPVSGSSYSYAYATMGEGLAWICGWCLVLEYGVSVAAVAVGAGQYVNEGLSTFNLSLPEAIVQPPGEGGILNIPAMLLVLSAMFLLTRGVKESLLINSIMVFVKVAVLLFFCVVAFSAFNSQNFDPLFPMGVAGVSAAASRLFFSYIGFDAASTAGEEARNPQRDLPKAILLSMGIVTFVYVAVAVAAVGAKTWDWFAGSEAALAQILEHVTGSSWSSLFFSVGAVVAIASIVLSVLYGQTRIVMSMSRDGLVPKIFGRISERNGTPIMGTLLIGSAIAIVSGLVPLGELADATTIGTLFAFTLVNLSVIYLRKQNPNLSRSFRVPLYPFVPLLGAVMCIFLMLNLRSITWVVFVVWMCFGFLFYFFYGRKNSVLAKMSEAVYQKAL